MSYPAGVQPDLSREWIQKRHGAQGAPKELPFTDKRIRNICLFVCLDLYLFFILYMYMYVPCVCSACGDQKRALVPPELKLQTVVGHLVGSAYQIRVLCKLHMLLTSGLSLQPQLGKLVLNTFVSHIGSSGRSHLDRLTPRTTLLVVLWTPKLWRVLPCTDISRVFTVYQTVS